jgi:hypothetical protein
LNSQNNDCSYDESDLEDDYDNDSFIDDTLPQEVYAIKELRKITKYDPSKYQNEDEDDEV